MKHGIKEDTTFAIKSAYPFNKSTSVFYAFYGAVIDHEFRHNIVKVAVDPPTVSSSRQSSLSHCLQPSFLFRMEYS